ncbi:unnamed protein product [Paramecium sonneborni]|uniref:Tyrosine-protein phosphatase domain-containing protein n=1 Tax=Paramecium sonneborni TaxID=65129 RepID=A0A8S1NVQ8_9CILI|nr:unnamed protein product [Paramecium sonneborni]
MFINSLNLRQMSSTISSRILDGIFIGNYIPLQEEQYLNINQITHIVNCSAQEIKAPPNLKVLNYHWKDEDNQIIITIENLIQITTFVERAIKQGESALFCCLNGQSRSLTALIGYLMYRYKWSLFKVLQYINIQKKDFEIRASFLKQLIDFEKKELSQFVISRNWNQISNDQEQTLLQNTYLNSVQKNQDDQIFMKLQPKTLNRTKRKVSWARCLIQQTPQIVYSICTKFMKQEKSILKNNNTNLLGGNNSQQKESPNNQKLKPRIIDEELFVKKNTYRLSDKKQRNLTPYNTKRFNNQNLITLNKKFESFLDIDINTQQIQKKHRSQTNTPKINKTQRFSSLDNQNNDSCILAAINQEKMRKSLLPQRRAQFKLINMI